MLILFSLLEVGLLLVRANLGEIILRHVYSRALNLGLRKLVSRSVVLEDNGVKQSSGTLGRELLRLLECLLRPLSVQTSPSSGRSFRNAAEL